MLPMQEQTTGYGRTEEFVNFLTHGGGLLLSLAAAFVLFSTVSGVDSSAMRLSCWVYAMALIALYGASTLSHSSNSPDRRHFYRSLDQGVIFVFIAANFTPFAIAHLPVTTCWLVVSAMWILAILGFTSKVFWRHRVESISILHYLALGWLPILVIVPILRSLPTTGIAWFAAGGFCYTLGTVFLAFDTRVRYFHALWHLLVIAGSSCHFYVVLDYVILLKV
jgi:hemolysin III